MSFAAFVQARMGSGRLPGKSMLPVWHEMPLIELVLRRVRASRSLSRVVLLTTTQPRDDPLVDVAQRLGLAAYRGSEEDVLGRFAGALRTNRADAVVRVCADNPFVAPEAIDALTSFFTASQPCDYATDAGRPRGRPDHFGAEVIAAGALRRAARLAAAAEREHVVGYLLGHPEKFSLAFAPAAPHWGKLAIDTLEDYAAMRTLAGRLPENDAPLWEPGVIVEACLSARRESATPAPSLRANLSS